MAAAGRGKATGGNDYVKTGSGDLRRLKLRGKSRFRAGSTLWTELLALEALHLVTVHSQEWLCYRTSPQAVKPCPDEKPRFRTDSEICDGGGGRGTGNGARGMHPKKREKRGKRAGKMERPRRLELPPAAWQAAVLPLNYGRASLSLADSGRAIYLVALPSQEVAEPIPEQHPDPDEVQQDDQAEAEEQVDEERAGAIARDHAVPAGFLVLQELLPSQLTSRMRVARTTGERFWRSAKRSARWRSM
jgi:hypothetical protein